MLEEEREIVVNEENNVETESIQNNFKLKTIVNSKVS